MGGPGHPRMAWVRDWHRTGVLKGYKSLTTLFFLNAGRKVVCHVFKFNSTRLKPILNVL